jgi:hypothetical protein
VQSELSLQGWLVAGLGAVAQKLSATGVPSLRVHTRVRTWVPVPHVVPQALQAEGSQLYVHALASVHACVSAGLGSAEQRLSATSAPSLARWHVTVRVCVPVPQVLEHAPQVPVHWYGHPLSSAHVCEASGFGSEQKLSGTVTPSLRSQVSVRDCVPTPHVVEQAPQVPVQW